ERLAAIWCDVLELDRVSVESSFFDLGGDSIRAVRVLAACREGGIPLSMWMILQAKSLAELAALAEEAEEDGARFPAEDGMPLLPGHLRWLEERPAGSSTLRLSLSGRADAEVLKQSLLAVVQHHQALHLRFEETANKQEGRGAAHLAEVDADLLLRVIDLGEVPADGRPVAITRAVDEGRAALDPLRGVLVQATLVRFGGDSADELYLSAHDLAVDAGSWPIVLGDLNSAYRRLSDGRPVQLPAVATPLHSWAQRLTDQAGSDELLDLAEAWLNRPEGTVLPVDHGRSDNGTAAAGNTITVALAPEATATLLADAEPEHLLLTALGRVLARWAGGDRIDIEVAVDARRGTADAPDLARTVGPLADSFPVSLRLPKDRDGSATLKSVARQLRALPVPHHGYGLLRHLAPDPELAAELAELPVPEIRFAFTPPQAVPSGSPDGDAPLIYVPEHVVPLERADEPAAVRGRLLDVDAHVYGGRLFVRWTHRTAVHDRSTVQRLADEQLAELGVLLSEGAATGSTRSTRSTPSARADGPAQAVRSASSAAAVFDGVEDVMARHGIPGASLALIRDGEVAEVRSFGVHGVDHAEPVTPETPFAAGSISKHLTAFTALRLASEGRIDLDRDINDYLSSWQVPGLGPDGAARPVSARLLLANLAGFALHPDLEDGYHRHDPVPTVLDVLNGRSPARTPAAYRQDEPGQVFRLTPVHYSVLQQAMTDLTGEAYPELVHRLVFEPLGMSGSSFEPRFPDLRDGSFARGHDAAGRPVPDGYFVNPEAAAGGLWSTAADLAALAVQVRRSYLGLAGALVDQELVRQMLTPQSGRSYGWSTIVDDFGGDLEFGHGGQAYGYQAMTGLRVHSGVGAVLLTNAVTGRELVQHVIAATWSGRARAARQWQQAIDEAVQREQRDGIRGSQGV
ncbi:serine hydrolase, partial [Streptomyces sp. NPDC058682]|uniref:serine hydrolase domain-containing protein n=1 Tax=Streptomyces sp. NPDC058682 TaxID=3346596 RepID=UPI0036650FEA